jgi:hypothetical protein
MAPPSALLVANEATTTCNVHVDAEPRYATATAAPTGGLVP